MWGFLMAYFRISGLTCLFWRLCSFPSYCFSSSGCVAHLRCSPCWSHLLVSAECLLGFTGFMNKSALFKGRWRSQHKEFVEGICWCPVRGASPPPAPLPWLIVQSMLLNNLHLEAALIKDHIWMWLHRRNDDCDDAWLTLDGSSRG